MKKFELESTIRTVQSRPAMWLLNQEKTDGASMFATFLHATYARGILSEPDRVVVASRGELHLVTAMNSRFLIESTLGEPVPDDFGGQTDLIEWLETKKLNLSGGEENPFRPFAGVCALIYASEFCLTDITTEQEHFRELFYCGRGVSPCERRQTPGEPFIAPHITLQFTLSPTIFKQKIIQPDEVERAISLLHEEKLLPREVKIRSTKDSFAGYEIVISRG